MAKKTPATQPADVEVGGPGQGKDEEFALVVENISDISFFGKNLVSFFREAKALEDKSLATLKLFREMREPQTAEEDEQVQLAVKRVNSGITKVEAHWEITAVITRFRNLLSSRRGRSVDALKESKDIGNRHHNAFVARKTREAQAEQDRLRRAAEEQARKDRQAELDALERLAADSEAASADLSEREQMFVNHVVGEMSPYEAAKRAQFQKPEATATRLLERPKVQAAIKGLRDALALRQQAAAQADQPLEVEVPDVRPDILQASGASDRTTWGGEVVDEAAVIEAFRSGKHGIPGDLFMVNPKKANEYGRSLHERLDLWPGMRHVKKTGVV